MMPLTVLWDCYMIHTLRGFSAFMLFAMLPFIVYVTIGRFFTDAWHRSRLIYVLTDRRALIIMQGVVEGARSVSLNGPTQIVLRQDGNRIGTVSFGPLGFSPWGGATFSSRAPSPAFEVIADAHEVHQLALGAQQR